MGQTPVPRPVQGKMHHRTMDGEPERTQQADGQTVVQFSDTVTRMSQSNWYVLVMHRHAVISVVIGPLCIEQSLQLIGSRSNK